MAIKRHYKCEEHGFFEAWEEECPQGCKTGLSVVFLRAPAYLSSRTKKSDNTLRRMADEFKMTNIKSTREGENQAGYYTRNNGPKIDAPPSPASGNGNGVIWGGGGRFNMQNVLANGAAQSVKGERVGFNPKDMGNLTGPKAASYMTDHEGLKIS